MKAKAVSVAVSLNRLPVVTFEFADKDFINSDMLDGRDLDLTVKTYRKKRSLNANAYMWELCTLIAEKVGVTKDEVYKEAVRNSGVFRDVELSNDAVSTIQTAWGLLGTGWITEKVDDSKVAGKAIVRLYYGTSKYNTKQMSRVIDGLVQDCKAIGIPTLDEIEIDKLINDWGKNEINNTV